MTKPPPKIATREEILELLSEKARDGQTGAMIALERALRARDREENEVDTAISSILNGSNGQA